MITIPGSEEPTPVPAHDSSAGPRTLASLRPGETAMIAGYRDELARDLRLAELGLIPGTLVKFVKAAPLGDPLEFLVRGFHLAISKKIAQAIFVK